MVQKYVVKQGPLTFTLETQPHQADPEMTTEQNMIEALARRMNAAEEVLKFFGYVIEKVDMPE